MHLNRAGSYDLHEHHYKNLWKGDASRIPKSMIILCCVSISCTSAWLMQKTCLWRLLLQLARELALAKTGLRPSLQLDLMRDTSLLTFHQPASGQHLCQACASTSEFMIFLRSRQQNDITLSTSWLFTHSRLCSAVLFPIGWYVGSCLPN